MTRPMTTASRAFLIFQDKIHKAIKRSTDAEATDKATVYDTDHATHLPLRFDAVGQPIPY